jgi:SOS-response transcriptional repressor LexA
VLSPINPDYAPIVIPPEDAEDFRIVAEFVAVMRSQRS